MRLEVQSCCVFLPALNLQCGRSLCSANCNYTSPVAPPIAIRHMSSYVRWAPHLRPMWRITPSCSSYLFLSSASRLAMDSPFSLIANFPSVFLVFQYFGFLPVCDSVVWRRFFILFYSVRPVCLYRSTFSDDVSDG